MGDFSFRTANDCGCDDGSDTFAVDWFIFYRNQKLSNKI
jgi:hypothetical protein